MRIAIISDTHLGYPRFEEDSIAQAERAIADASSRADLIIHAGDIFDTKNPKLETISRAISMFRKSRVPVMAIHGNHERRSKDLVNPAQLLATAGVITLMHGRSESFEKNGERVQVFGLGNVPEEFAEIALKKSLESFAPDKDAFRVLVIHQSVKELMQGGGEDELSLEFLETLPFDLVIDGHIHQREIRLNGRFIIPGSTVITQLKEDETAPRGYELYDTKSRAHEFVPVACRKFFYAELAFKDASLLEVRNAVDAKVAELRKGHEGALVRVKVKGTLKEGLDSAGLGLPSDENTYIDNELNSAGIADKIKRIRELKDKKLSVREVAVKELEQKIGGKITLFKPFELFDKLLIGSEEALEYLKETAGGETPETKRDVS